MIVEIVGPPGVGKTTIAAGLDELARSSALPLLSFADYQAMDREFGEAAIMKKQRVGRWATLAPLAWRRPRLFFPVVLLTLLHGRPLLRRGRKAQRLLAHTLFTERLQARCPGRIVVHHDGFTQCLWSTLIDSRSLRGKAMIASILRGYYERVQPKIILLEVGDERAASRVFGRTSKGRFNRDSPPRRRKEFERWLAYHRALVALLPASLAATRIDAAIPAPALAEAVLEALGAMDTTTRLP